MTSYCVKAFATSLICLTSLYTLAQTIPAEQTPRAILDEPSTLEDYGLDGSIKTLEIRAFALEDGQRTTQSNLSHQSFIEMGALAYTFDEQGRLIKYDYLNFEDEPYREHELFYDGELYMGYTTRGFVARGQSEPDEWLEHSYDAEGRLIRTESYDRHGKGLQHYVFDYSYNDEGQLQEIARRTLFDGQNDVYYEPDEQPVRYERFTYDEAGRVIEISNLNSFIDKYYYTSDGRLRLREYYTSFVQGGEVCGPLPTSQVFYVYDADASLTEELRVYMDYGDTFCEDIPIPQLGLSTINRFANNQLHQKLLVRNSAISSGELYEWEGNRLIRVASTTSENIEDAQGRICEYRAFDDYGNWTERYCIRDGFSQLDSLGVEGGVVTRSFTYF